VRKNRGADLIAATQVEKPKVMKMKMMMMTMMTMMKRRRRGQRRMKTEMKWK